VLRCVSFESHCLRVALWRTILQLVIVLVCRIACEAHPNACSNKLDDT
jgi:hypothetical protein